MTDTTRSARRLLLDQTEAAMLAAADGASLIDHARTAARRILAADGFTFVKRIGEQTDYLAEDAIETLWAGMQFDIDKCLAGRAMLREQTIVIPDITHVENIPLNVYLATFIRSLVAVPFGGHPPGYAICGYWREARTFEPEDVAIAEAFAYAIERAIERLGPDAPWDSTAV